LATVRRRKQEPTEILPDLEEQFPVYLDPDDILEEERFRPSEMTPWERFLEWDGTFSVVSAGCAGLSFLLLCICFGITVGTRGGAAFGTAVAGLCGMLFGIYGVGFGWQAIRKKERRRFIGRAGLVFSGVCLAAWLGIYIIGVL